MKCQRPLMPRMEADFEDLGENKKVTDSLGYVPTEQLVSAFFSAGVDLQASRNGFEFSEEDEENFDVDGDVFEERSTNSTDNLLEVSNKLETKIESASRELSTKNSANSEQELNKKATSEEVSGSSVVGNSAKEETNVSVDSKIED